MQTMTKARAKLRLQIDLQALKNYRAYLKHNRKDTASRTIEAEETERMIQDRQESLASFEEDWRDVDDTEAL